MTSLYHTPPVRSGVLPAPLHVRLQRTGAACRRKRRPGHPLQPRLAVGAPGDRYEQEADRIAGRVVRTRGPAQAAPLPVSALQPHALGAGSLQAAEAVPDAAPGVAPAIQALRGGGQPLDPKTRAFMEPRFGHDFSRVRVHHGAQSAALARSMHAHAFTVGRDVFFGAGRFAPERAAGRMLLAHELTHVVQQTGIHGTGAPGTASGLPIQMQGSFPWEGAVATATDPLMLRATPTVPSPSHLNAMGKLPKDGRVTVLGGNKLTWLKVRGTTTEGVEKTGFVLGSYIREATGPAGAALSVDRVDVVTTPSGAIGSFSGVVGKSDLNVPGPFNDPETGEVTNVHQIHFHLDSGDALRTKPVREVKATWTYPSIVSKVPQDQPPPGGKGAPVPGGFGGATFEPDGPAPWEVRYPAPDKIVVADPPGVKWLFDSDYPFSMDMDFRLTLLSAETGVHLAEVTYEVHIEKTSPTDIPNTRNEVVVKSKEDLVRGRSLPP